ncbi:MAG: ATP-grasp domain-containing protein [Planctomycetes bacterium]|nr:ATP-grasp domain-containing protein [Planctomycetota bacterium]
MIILDKPYTSEQTAAYLAESGRPVLRNAEAERIAQNHRLNLVEPGDFAKQVDDGARLYTVSENALDWVMANVKRKNIADGISSMKDKFCLRETLSPLYPDYFFAKATFEQLQAMDPASLTLPLVLKPTVGFFSIGVYAIESVADWRAALADLAATRASWGDAYPAEVVGTGSFILEQYINGDEYALDAYFNSQGEAVILDILKHDFTSASDVSDRLYYTGAEVITTMLDKFQTFLSEVNRHLRLTDFPFHAEVRVDGDSIIPIEFNPLRFAGWCTTELSSPAYGMLTYDYYLRDRKPDWNALLGKGDDYYSMVILDKPADIPADAKLDYDAVCSIFTEVVEIRKTEWQGAPIFGYLFARSPRDRKHELTAAIQADMRRYLLPGC